VARLQAASARGRLGPLAAHALGLTGLTAAACHLLQLIAATPSPPLQDAAVEAFGAITGVEEGADGSGRAPADRAQDLQRAWALGPPAQRATPRLFGGPRTAAGLLQAAPLMQVGRWQSYRRLLRMRSGNGVRLASWALMEQQLAEVTAQTPQADLALSPAAPGLRPNPLTAALARLGCNQVLPLPSPLEGVWA